MKKLFSWYLILFFAVGSLLFVGCKKGKEDPFFSLISRKNRVTGYWDFDQMERNALTKFQNGVFYNELFTVNGESVSVKRDTTQGGDSDTSFTIKGKVKEAYYRFDKDGRMDYLFRYELIDNKITTDENTEYVTTERTTTTVEQKGTGTWNFLNKIDNYKNKERISLVFESYNKKTTINLFMDIQDPGNEDISLPGYPFVTNKVYNQENKWANGEFAEVWVLDMLKNREIHMSRQLDNLELTGTSTDTLNTTTLINTIGYEWLYLKQEK